jgi:hypothetical protein
LPKYCRNNVRCSLVLVFHVVDHEFQEFGREKEGKRRASEPRTRQQKSDGHLVKVYFLVGFAFGMGADVARYAKKVQFSHLVCFPSKGIRFQPVLNRCVVTFLPGKTMKNIQDVESDSLVMSS